jgi:hypothetical protein
LALSASPLFDVSVRGRERSIALAMVVAMLLVVGGGIARIAPAGHGRAKTLATMLAANRFAEVESQVAPASRSGLSQAALRLGWAEAVALVGPLRSVTRVGDVAETAGLFHLEQLVFAHGRGTLAALRTPDGIDGLYLLTGADTGVSSQARAGATYALDLVAGNYQPLIARFTPDMTAGLPLSKLRSDSSGILAGLGSRAKVWTQLVQHKGRYFVVETYLRFPQGVIRVELALTADGHIAGLFLRTI